MYVLIMFDGKIISAPPDLYNICNKFNIFKRSICENIFNKNIKISYNIHQENFYDKIPKYVTHLYFSNNINRKIIIPNHITHLTLSYSFNQKINIPNSVTHLTLGHAFNKKIVIPNSVTHLTFGHTFNKKIEIPNSVTHLTFGNLFNQKINIPNSVKHLIVNKSFDKKIVSPIYLLSLDIHKLSSNKEAKIIHNNYLLYVTTYFTKFNKCVLPNSVIKIKFAFFGKKLATSTIENYINNYTNNLKIKHKIKNNILYVQIFNKKIKNKEFKLCKLSTGVVTIKNCCN